MPEHSTDPQNIPEHLLKYPLTLEECYPPQDLAGESIEEEVTEEQVEQARNTLREILSKGLPLAQRFFVCKWQGTFLEEFPQASSKEIQEATIEAILMGKIDGFRA